MDDESQVSDSGMPREKRELTREEFLERLERAARSLRRQELGLAFLSFSLGLGYLIFMLAGGSVALRRFVTREGVNQSQWALVFWYLLFFTLIYHGLHLPLSFVRGYVIQKRFRLSNQRLRRWAWAHMKKVLVSVALVVFAGEFLYLFLRQVPRAWWLAAWVGYVVFGLLVSRFGSRVLLPLFYKRTDLEHGPVRERIEETVRRAGFRVSGVKRIILEKDTRKANAAVFGLGGTKEILVSDTLLASLDADEIEAVVAHELGHSRLHHGEWIFAVGMVISFLAFALAGGVLAQSARSMGLSGVDDVAGFPLIILVFSGLYFLVTPPLNYVSRQMEKSADLWAARFTGRPDALASGLEKLSANNLSERRQPRYYEIIFSTHPSVDRRAAYLRAAAARR